MFRVFAVDPPGKADQKLMENGLKELAICRPTVFLLDLVNAPGSPGQHGRIHVAKVPLVGRNLTVRVLVPLT